KLSIAEAKKYSAKKVDVEMLLEEISEKFDRQQEKIDELESKIEKLFKTRPSNMNEFDIKAIVEEVLAQVGGGKGDAKLSKKVDSIEKQITQLSKNIEKLTSYVD
ncbi:MAG TPA: hypothetical protein PKI94_08570, partial [Candidatus Gastranaerophilaceae bacterium]|nr:hypothetical protein [Candidatus Gastranaerophilaceae bacterium]